MNAVAENVSAEPAEPEPPVRSRRILPTRTLVAGILLAGLALRLWGITWGAPERWDLHPDESEHVMNHALSLSLHDLDPKFLNYPSFIMYVIAAVNGIAADLGWVTAEWQSYVLGRCVVAASGTLTIALAAALASELGASALGTILAALWVALLPLHVWESHVAVTDVFMTFWVLAALVAALRVLRRERDLDVALAGICTGLAAASKYTAAVLVLSVAAAILLSRRSPSAMTRSLLFAGACAALAFAVATPFSLIHLGDFLAAVTFEMHHVHGHHAGFSVPAAGPQYHRYLYQLVAGFPFSYGLVLYPSVLAGGLWAATRLDRRYVIVLLFAVIFFGVIGSWTFTPLRYTIPVVVLGAIFAGLWQADWIEGRDSRRRAVALAMTGAALLYTAAFTVDTTSRYADDTRIQAGRWLGDTLQPTQRILLVGWRPYMAVPSHLPPEAVVSRNEGVVGNFVSYHDFPLVEISSLHYLRWYRHGHPRLLPAYEHLRRELGPMRLVKRFEADYLNRSFYCRLDPMFESYFISPTLEFYSPPGGPFDPRPPQAAPAPAAG